MVDQDELEPTLEDVLEKKLWIVRDMVDNPEKTYPHNHNAVWKGKELIRECPLTEQLGCFIDTQIITSLGSNPRTIFQADMGHIYNHILGIIMAVGYSRMMPDTGARKIFKYLHNLSKENKLINDPYKLIEEVES